MSKSKFGNSNLYMTTSEFADLVIDSLDEQGYFKKDEVAHPEDISYAFSTIGAAIGTAMGWAIRNEQNAIAQKKQALMNNINLSKGTTTSTSNSVTNDDWVIGYNEWKKNK